MFLRIKNFGILLAILSLCMLPVAISAQTTGAATNTPKSEKIEMQTPRDDFREELKHFNADIDGLGKQVETVTKRLEGMSGATVDSRKKEMESLRERLVQLGTKLQGDAPLAQAIEKYDSWIAAQLGRLNTLRQSLGPQFIEDLIKRYRAYQAEVSNSRQMLNQQQKDLDTTLRELTIAEMRAAEALLAEDAGAAVAELRETIKTVAKTIDTIRARMRAFGAAAV